MRLFFLAFLIAMTVSANLLRSHDKLLSHRGRGFGYPEATLEAVRQSLKSGIRYLELDTRVDSDKVIYCYHHSRLLTWTGLPLLRDLAGDVVAREGILRLDEALDAVAKVIAPDQRLCLDIKDCGFEQDHVDLVEHYDLAGNTVFISWIPQTLQRLHEISSIFPLILGHINLQFLRIGSDLVERLIGERELRLFDFILLGPRSLTRTMAHTVGFQHGLLCAELPEPYIRLLQDSGGGICVPHICLCDRLDAWCVSHHLRQWVFTVNNETRYGQLVDRKAIDVVFTDDPIGIALRYVPCHVSSGQ
jgi:glycerophosphoryl diester phosphodiesterase